MKKFMTYARNNKGISLILIAIMLAVLIIFAALAIDISYMYFEKNQLQVAADAAALAGAARIDCDDSGTTCDLAVYDTNAANYGRIPARKEANYFSLIIIDATKAAFFPLRELKT